MFIIFIIIESAKVDVEWHMQIADKSGLWSELGKSGQILSRL